MRNLVADPGFGFHNQLAAIRENLYVEIADRLLLSSTAKVFA
jgi:hypothetical protein